MTATFMPIPCVVSKTNPVAGNEADAGWAPLVPFDGVDFVFDEITRCTAPRIPYLSRLLQRTTRQWSVCVIETCVAQKSCKGLCSKEVRIFEHASIVSATSDND